MPIGPGGLIEADRSVRIERVFRWLGRRMFRKDFHAVRAVAGSLDVIREASAHDGPLIVFGNHVSWWDPMLAVLFTDLHMPGRSMVAAMDTDELQRFGIFRKLGVFGIRPGDRDALEPMVGYLDRVFQREPKSVLWVTPQGEFADVRTQLRLRPGSATVMSRLEAAGIPVRALSLAVEYGFWVERKPEMFIRAQHLQRPDKPVGQASTTDWLRVMTAELASNMHTLAAHVQARKPEAFEIVLGGDQGNVNPIYDAWLSLRGKKRALGNQ